MRSYAALDLMVSSGSVDVFHVCKELVKRRPGLDLGTARLHVSGYLIRDKRSEDGKKRYPNGKPTNDWRHEFDDWAPVGQMVCPEKCDWGWIVKGEVKCNTCNGHGFLYLDGTVVVNPDGSRVIKENADG